MSLRRAKVTSLVCATALALAACNTSPEQLNQTAELILTRSAEITPGAYIGADATLDPNAPLITATPSLIYALCIVRAPSQLLIEPSASAQLMGEVQARDVITAYGRTSDAQWVLGWNKADTYGWVTSNAIGCTVPIPELMPTESNVLRLTPIAVAEQNATPAPADITATTTPTVVPTTASTAAPTNTVVPPQPTETPIPATSMSTTEPTATSAPVATAPSPTPAPTDTPIPTVAVLPAATSAPTAQATRIVIVQVVTVVVTVTAMPVQPTMRPTLTPTQQPAVTTPTTTPPTAVPTLVVLQELRCVVTPGTPVNLRTGPARTERLLGQLREAAPFVVAGRNEDGSWLYGVTARGTIGWLIASAVSCEDDVNRLPVVDR